MPRKMTRSEFEKTFGISVDDYLNSPEYVKINNPAQPTASGTDFYSDPNVLKAASNAVIAKPDTGTRVPEQAEQQTAAENLGVTSLIPKSVDRLQSNMVAGALSIPGAIPALEGLIRIGGEAGLDYLTSDDPSQELGKTFTDTFISPKDQAELDGQIQNAVHVYASQHPDATQQDLSNFKQQYLESDQFYNAVSEKMPPEFRWSRKVQDASNQIAGVGKRSDQMTAGDEVMQAVGGAFVGLPAKAVDTITRGITRVVGKRVAQSLAGKIAARTAEIVTPVTFPLNATNIGLNAAAGAALTEGTRYLQGEDTLIDYDQVFDQAEKASAIPAAAIFGLAALDPAALGRAMRGKAEKVTEDGLSKLAGKFGEGRPIDKQDPNALKPVLNKATGASDELSQATHAGQQFGATPDQLDDLEIAAVGGSYHARKEIENRIHTYGELDPGHTTIPLQNIDRAIASLGNDAERQRATMYLFAKSRKQDEKIQYDQLMRDTENELSGLMNAKGAGNTQAAVAHEARLKELQQQHQAIQSDDPSARPNLRQFSRKEIDDAIKAGDADPRLVSIRKAVEKYSNDILDYERRHGEISQERFDQLRTDRPLYFKLRQQDAPGTTGLRRRAVLFANRMKRDFAGSNPNEKAPDILSGATRDVSVRDSANVELPKDIISSLRAMTSDAVHRVQTNEARKGMMDVFSRLPGAEGTLFKYHEFGKGRKLINQSQFDHATKNMDLTDYVRINDGDKVMLVKFGDEGIRNLMKFQPNATLPILNGMRRVFQEFTTGLGHPAFAAVQAFREPWLAATEKGADRTYGYLNTFTHRLVEGSALAKTFDAFDPTRAVVGLNTIPVQLWERSVKSLAHKAATDLEQGSGVFNTIAQATGGKEYINNIALQQILALEKTSYGILRRRMGASFGYMNDINRINDDFAHAASKSTGVLRGTYNMYKAVLESLHTSARVAFWQENLGNLSKKYGGFDNIPEQELKRLELDTRKIGGDIGRRSKNKWIQRGTSAVPYSNTILQGNRQLLASAMPNSLAKLSNKTLGTNFLMKKNSSFWPVVISSVLMPKVVSMAVMSEWPEADDWWYHKVPSWQRPLVLPIPTPEAIATRVKTGKWPEGDPSKSFYKIPLPPDFIPIIMPFEAGMRATGIFGNDVKELPPVLKQMKDFATEFAGMPKPPALGIYDAVTKPEDARMGFPMGGANSDKVSPHNYMSQQFYDVIAAVGATGMKNLADAYNVGELAYKDGQGIAGSLGRAMNTLVDNERQGLPEVGIPMLYKANERKYAMTPDAEYVYDTEHELEAIRNQLTVERDTKGRLAAANAIGSEAGSKLKDPRLLAISQIVYDATNKKGDYKAANDQYAQYRLALNGLQRQRMSPARYNFMRSELIKQQQIVRSTQARILRDLEGQIQEAVGPTFEQAYGMPFSYAALSKLVKRDTAQ